MYTSSKKNKNENTQNTKNTITQKYTCTRLLHPKGCICQTTHNSTMQIHAPSLPQVVTLTPPSMTWPDPGCEKNWAKYCGKVGWGGVNCIDSCNVVTWTSTRFFGLGQRHAHNFLSNIIWITLKSKCIHSMRKIFHVPAGYNLYTPALLKYMGGWVITTIVHYRASNIKVAYLFCSHISPAQQQRQQLIWTVLVFPVNSPHTM